MHPVPLASLHIFRSFAVSAPLHAACDILTRYMGLFILGCSALALRQPELFRWVAPHVTPLLGCIMFGMGMTLRLNDFTCVFSRPRPLLLGLAAQFVCMPLAAFGLCKALALPPELAMGVILVGTAPGGTASNVLTYIAGGDVPYSVALTALATLVSLGLMPVLTWFLGGVWVPVDMAALFFSILKIVILPVALGLAAHRFCEGLCSRALPYLPAASALTITLVVAGIIAVNAANILNAGVAVFAAVICHNLFGLGLGYLAGTLWKFDMPRRRALCLEIGTQNSGLASALALVHFTPASAIAGALFSVWQNISGALLANWFHTRQEKPQEARPDGAGRAA
ncbi:MAG: bile acid:sodium symporter family protein [Desulfovibrio desulfuricans]|jgi:BASS family bile acid:Na+ symporter|nr:bile acid:sodium symporter family protein [Desulfovibrio desulfuricans]